MRVPAADESAAGRAVTVALALVALAVASGAAGPIPGPDGHAAGQSPAEGHVADEHAADGIAATLAQDIDADAVVLAADVRADGDADWRVTYRLTLDTEERETAFQELQSDVENNASAYLDPFEARMTDTATAASEATGREMSVASVTVETERESQPQAAFGLVTFRFEWVGFAAVEGDTVRAGDSLDQLILGESERLQFSWPDGYSRQSSSPEPDTVEEGRVVWRGPVDFDAGQPRVELVADEGTDTMLALAGLAAVVLALGAAAIFWRRRRHATEAEEPADAGDGAVATADAEAEETSETGDEEPDEASGEGPPPELLSNEERVIHLLENNGGRMKQGAVAEQLDWTAAKTSQVVSDLREEDAVESFRLGRENVLTLPDVDIMDSDDADGSEKREE